MANDPIYEPNASKAFAASADMLLLFEAATSRNLQKANAKLLPQLKALPVKDLETLHQQGRAALQAVSALTLTNDQELAQAATISLVNNIRKVINLPPVFGTSLSDIEEAATEGANQRQQSIDDAKTETDNSQDENHQGLHTDPPPTPPRTPPPLQKIKTKLQAALSETTTPAGIAVTQPALNTRRTRSAGPNVPKTPTSKKTPLKKDVLKTQKKTPQAKPGSAKRRTGIDNTQQLRINANQELAKETRQNEQARLNLLPNRPLSAAIRSAWSAILKNVRLSLSKSPPSINAWAADTKIAIRIIESAETQSHKKNAESLAKEAQARHEQRARVDVNNRSKEQELAKLVRISQDLSTQRTINGLQKEQLAQSKKTENQLRDKIETLTGAVAFTKGQLQTYQDKTTKGAPKPVTNRTNDHQDPADETATITKRKETTKYEPHTPTKNAQPRNLNIRRHPQKKEPDHDTNQSLTTPPQFNLDWKTSQRNKLDEDIQQSAVKDQQRTHARIEVANQKLRKKHARPSDTTSKQQSDNHTSKRFRKLFSPSEIQQDKRRNHGERTDTLYHNTTNRNKAPRNRQHYQPNPSDNVYNYSFPKGNLLTAQYRDDEDSEEDHKKGQDSREHRN